MTSLVAALSRLAGQAFAAEGLPDSFGQVQVSDRPDLAQFQCNGALAAAKATKANPRAIAEKIVARLKAECDPALDFGEGKASRSGRQRQADRSVSRYQERPGEGGGIWALR